VGEFDKGFSVYELKWLAGRELRCVPREAARGDEDATIYALCSYHP
jgi:hypothetical protein